MRDQVTGTTYSDGTPAITISYDAAGRPLEIGNAVATDAYAYDDAGQLAVETQSVAGHPAAMRTLTHSHDADGLRTGLVYPGGKVLAAGYTARGQLATMTFHGQPVATSTYRPNGQPIGTVYGNGAQRTLSYDAAGRLTGTGTNVGAATITGRGYALDAVGRRTGYVDETAANAVFSYDPAGQVLGGTVPVPGQPASVNTYTYDPEGNRTQSSTGIQPAPADPVTITGSTTYTANPLNHYTAITGNPNPTYDADGNLLSGLRSPLSGFTCTWNGENRMLSSTSANVAITDRRVENAYDALGRRVRKTVKFASTGAVIEDRYFIYDGWNVIEETIAPATGPVETAEAVWGTDLSGTAQGAGGVGGLLLRETTANGASYYHYDGNGNVTALTSGAGTVQAAYTYGPFGETLRAVGPLAQANPWRFSTKYQDDETGLLYYGYRFYNPTDGRWPSRDPIEEDGGLNLYGFVGNAPLGRIDVLGLRDLTAGENGYVSNLEAQAAQFEKTNPELSKALRAVISDYKTLIGGLKGKKNPARVRMLNYAFEAWTDAGNTTNYKINGNNYKCSLFVRRALKAGGIDPREWSATDFVDEPSRGVLKIIYKIEGKNVSGSIDRLQPEVKINVRPAKLGDIIAMGNEGQSGTNLGHVGIYLGSGLFLNATRHVGSGIPPTAGIPTETGGIGIRFYYKLEVEAHDIIIFRSSDGK